LENPQCQRQEDAIIHCNLSPPKQNTNQVTTCLWKEVLSQQRIRHFKILQSIYFAYDVGIISSYSNR